jgi:alpha-beta hydrolase superfamily lysophospholipase
MPRKFLRWVWARRKRTAGLLLLLLAVAVNAIAYLHARAMTHFTRDGTRTPSPESMSPLQKAEVLLTGVRLPKPSSDAIPDRFGLPFETHRLLGDGGVELAAWYVPRPDARGLVLLFHGYAACKAALLPEVKALHDLGYASFAVDFRGCGDSTGWDTTIGYHEAQDVALAVGYARDRWAPRRVVLYGQSMGSAAILRAVAVQGVAPDAVVVECPFDRLLSTVENRFDAMGVPHFPGARLLVFWGGVQHGFSGFAHNPVDYAGEVRCPVLLMHGGHDPRVTEAQAEAIFERLAGKKQFVRFPESGHRPLLAEDPDRWRQVVSQFLSERSGPEGPGTK